MALTKLSCLLVVVFLAGVTSTATGARYFPQNGTAFRENILVLPTDLPAQAAATRFASTQAGDGDDRALALSVCLGDSAPAQYRESLAAAVADVVAGCGAASRRAGAWLDGCYCYLAADTNMTTSPSGGSSTGGSDNLYATFLDMSNGVAARMLATTATQAIDVGAATTTGLAGRVVAQCAAGVAPADCVQCLEGAAREMPRCFREARREEQGEGVGIVVSDDCVLRFDMTSSPAPRTSNTCDGTCKLLAFAFGAALE
ncbi:Os01g0774100 [Oryza sativa Japonica Group]|uniref:Os01g0774100 protein n=1 Tax=Oryza sativa subsp. japonica TaxID=39947 RepID=C7IX58_ORYSJ|nr:Os01g0774100 [Oryza sativa Japonica Group]|eukprot:NP_001172585.1 Os01g0774100 [Oryza sativa Japonica Group]